MKFKIKNSELLNLTNILSKLVKLDMHYLSSKYSLMILKDNKLEVNANSRGITYKKNIEVEGSEDGEGVYPPDDIKQILLGIAKNEIIEIEITKEKINIKHSKGKYSIKLENVVENMEMIPYRMPDKEIEIVPEQLNGILDVGVAGFKGEFKPNLECIDISIKGKQLEAMATDSFVLAYTKTDIMYGDIDEVRILLPLDYVDFLRGEDSSFYIGINERLVMRNDIGDVIAINYINEKPTEYHKILDQEKPYAIIVDRGELLDALKRLNAIKMEAVGYVNIVIEDKLYLIVDEEKAQGKEEIVFNAEMVDQIVPSSIHFDISRLIKCITYLQDSDIKICYGEQSCPILITELKGQRKSIIMPIKENYLEK